MIITKTNRIQCMMIHSLTALNLRITYIKSECLEEKKHIYKNQIALSLVTGSRSFLFLAQLICFCMYSGEKDMCDENEWG